MLKKIACVGIALVLIMVCATNLFLKRKMDRLTAEDYNRYVINAYPDFDTSLYDPVSVSSAGYGELSLMYIGPELLKPLLDPNIIDERRNDDVIEIFHYDLFTNEVSHIA